MFGLKWPGKKRMQRNLLLTEDSRILDVSMPVVKGYVVSDGTAEAWGLFPDSRIPERGTDHLYQVITERDAAPMSLNGGDNSKRLKETLSQVAQERASQARADVQKDSAKSKLTGTLQLLLIILSITVGVVVIFGLFMSGKVSFPGTGGGGGGLFSGFPLVLGFFTPIWLHIPGHRRRGRKS